LFSEIELAGLARGVGLIMSGAWLIDRVRVLRMAE